MRKHEKKVWLNDLENLTEKHIVKATKTFQNLSEDTLLKTPKGGGWSAAQCLEHLNSYGRFYIPEVKNALLKSKESEHHIYVSGILGNYFINMMKNTNSKFNAFKGHIPSSDLNTAAVVAEFIHQQEEWLSLIKAFENRNLNVRTPISISNLVKLKVGDILAFVKAHDERHIKQIERVLV